MTGEYEQTFVSIMRVQFIEKILTLLMSSKGLLTQKYVRLHYANIEIIMLAFICLNSPHFVNM